MPAATVTTSGSVLPAPVLIPLFSGHSIIVNTAEYYFGKPSLNPFVFRAFDNHKQLHKDAGRVLVLIPLFSGHSIIAFAAAPVLVYKSLNPFVFRAFDNRPRHICNRVMDGVLIPLFSGHSIIRDRRFNVSAQ